MDHVQSREQPVSLDDTPLRPFHWRVAAASTVGVFTDGFGLGIVGIALGFATPALHLTPLWVGLLGGASLAGLFFGALLTGPFADRVGRRPVFAYNMIFLTSFSALQFLASSAMVLLMLRVVIGFLLGTDYVVSKAVLTEFAPRAVRGRILSVLSVAWAGGYTCAYLAGYALTSAGPQAWRWMLLVSAVPSLLVLPLRLGMPESPLWLIAHGRSSEARRVVLAALGPQVSIPPSVPTQLPVSGRWRELFAPAWRRRTAVACAFFTCQVVPYFAVGTFVARVMSALHVDGGYLGGVFYNVSLLAGAVLGLLVIDQMPRRTFLVGSFAITAAAMLILTLVDQLPSVIIIGLFAIFACVLSAASNLVYVYLPELFPTELRASGIGLAIAASRIGSAASTFVLPQIVAQSGVHVALGGCVVVLVFGGVICARWAPETRNARLGTAVPQAA